MSFSVDKTVNDVLDAMAREDVLETFVHLPVADLERFSRWIGQARDEEAYRSRINALILALKTGPFNPIRFMEAVDERQDTAG